MTNYNDGKWHGWNGGECPVHPESWVEWIPMQENIVCGDPSNYNQSKDIPWKLLPSDKYHVIAFRVVEQYKEPREFWAVNMTWWKGVPDGTRQWVEVEPGTRNATLFREVIE